jgi:hypothetical protein
MNVISDVNIMKNKSHKIILIYAEKAFDKLNILQAKNTKLGINRTYLNIIKVKYTKLMANITLNGEKLKIFPNIWDKDPLVHQFYST